MIEPEMVLCLPGFQITGCSKQDGVIRILTRFTGEKSCAHCGGSSLRSKGWVERTVRHEDWGQRRCLLVILLPKSLCRDCNRCSRQRLPGILPYQRASQAFQQLIFQMHLDGINRSRLGRRKGIGAATVERYFCAGLQRQFSELHPPECPTVLGIDEHFFTRRKGYATTLCDLRNHKIYDVVLGRSEASLEGWLNRLEGKAGVRIVCMDLASVYRALVRKHFPNAQIVADRFHVIRLILQHFLACWRDIDPVGAKNRGLMSLMRRHARNLTPEQQVRLQMYLDQNPALKIIYGFKERLCHLLTQKHRTRKQCEKLVPRLLRAIHQLRTAVLPHLVQLGDSLYSWRSEIALMWRFTRNNGITEGFHNKMELISRQAYGFRNFENYRMRVKVLCA